MTTFSTIELKCPCCKKKFETQSLMSTNNAGPKTTDLYQRAGGYQPLAIFIHTCPVCAYTGGDGDFGNIKIEKKVKELIKSRLTPIVKDESVFPGRKYEYSAWIHKWRGSRNLLIGELYLKAAWCCTDDGKEDEEIFFRKQVIEYFEKGIEENEIPDNENPIYKYLIGEMYRRIGDKKNASYWYEDTIKSIHNREEMKGLLELARQQQNSPKEFI